MGAAVARVVGPVVVEPMMLGPVVVPPEGREAVVVVTVGEGDGLGRSRRHSHPTATAQAATMAMILLALMSYPSIHRCLLGTIYSRLHDKQIHTLLRQKENKHLPFLPFLLRLNYPNRLFGTFCAGFVEATFPFCRHFFVTAYRTTR